MERMDGNELEDEISLHPSVVTCTGMTPSNANCHNMNDKMAQGLSFIQLRAPESESKRREGPVEMRIASVSEEQRNFVSPQISANRRFSFLHTISDGIGFVVLTKTQL